MKPEVFFHDLGMAAYRETWEFQESLFAEAQAKKQFNRENAGGPLPVNHLLFCEHPHVYTLGKSGYSANLLIPEDTLKEEGITVFRTNRGGDITYHGPGQLVGYPVLDLEQFGLSIRTYMDCLEECMIQLIAFYGLKSSRLDGATGVWLDAGTAKARKICAMGVRASRHITMHGFALNVNTDLRYFSRINPCGFTDKGVTSIAVETGEIIEMEDLKRKALEIFSRLFGMHLITA